LPHGQVTYREFSEFWSGRNIHHQVKKRRKKERTLTIGEGVMKSRLLISTFFILMILAFTQTQAREGFLSGNKLVELMRERDRMEAGASDVDYVKVREYSGYIAGVYDATDWQYDTPDQVTVGQVVAVVSKFLKENHERWSEPAADLVMDALKKAFPLKEKK
jgi:hypothetical protein